MRDPMIKYDDGMNWKACEDNVNAVAEAANAAKTAKTDSMKIVFYGISKTLFFH